jgi:D,D-heptose 1,7-bisphosphate phosphatase
MKFKMRHKAVFVDRDGTINVDGPYLSDPDKFKMYPGVGNGIKKLKESGFKIIVITNQSGIARGYFTEKDLAEIHAKMKRELKKYEVELDGIYYCPHHPDDNCNCRKPKTGLLDKAIKDHDIVVEKSYMIGDKIHDIEAGKKIGTKGILIPLRDGKDETILEVHQWCCHPDYVACDFEDAVGWVLKNK